MLLVSDIMCIQSKKNMFSLFILMNFPKHIDTIGHRSKVLNYDEFMFLKIVFIRASSADPAFYVDLHCLPK